MKSTIFFSMILGIMITGLLFTGIGQNAYAVNATCWSANPNLAVSTENIATSNVFGGPMVTEVLICDSDLAGTNDAKGEPDVTVNGRSLRMAQDNTGVWHGYFADKNQTQAADQSANISSGPGIDLDLGYFCSNQSIIPISSSAFTDTVGIVLPVNTTISGSQGTMPFPLCSGVPTSPNHNNVINGFSTLNTALPSIGQIGITDTQFWPFIQLYNFVENGTAVVQYNKGGGVQSTILTFDSSSAKVDSDGDGIADIVDTNPTNPSSSFSDIPLGGTTFGSITTSGDQTITILNDANINGVNINGVIISASPHGGVTPATISDCNGTIYTLTPGDIVVLACASSDSKITNGPVGAEYFVDGASLVTATLPTGADVTFEQDVPSFTNNGSISVIIKVVGAEITVDAGETVLFSIIDSDMRGNQKVNEGETLIIGNGATLTGNIKVKGGTLIIHEDSTVTGNIQVSNGGTLRIDHSSAGGDMEVKNSSLTVDHGTTGGDMEVKNSSLTVDHGTTGGDMDIKNSSISMNDVIIAGDLKIKDSVGRIGGTTIQGDIDVKKSSISMNDVTVGGDEEIKAKKVAKFKAGKALAESVR